MRIVRRETWHVGNSMRLKSIPSEWQFENPERFRKIVDSLHILAGEIVDLHRNLIRTARDYFVGII